MITNTHTLHALIRLATESKKPINIDEVFETEKTVFRLFYMIYNNLSSWRVQGEQK